MDKLAKRAGVAALVLIASAGSALAFGLYRMASSLEASSGQNENPQLAAAIRLPQAPLARAPIVAAPEPAAAAPAPAKPDEAAKPGPAPKADLASAFGAALGVDPKRAARTATGEPHAENASDTPKAPDMLTLSGATRDVKLGDREAKSVGVRQTGGAEQQRKADKTAGERISFETDLGQAH